MKHTLMQCSFHVEYDLVNCKYTIVDSLTFNIPSESPIAIVLWSDSSFDLRLLQAGIIGVLFKHIVVTVVRLNASIVFAISLNDSGALPTGLVAQVNRIIVGAMHACKIFTDRIDCVASYHIAINRLLKYN